MLQRPHYENRTRLLGIRLQTTDLHCPWQNGRFELFFGTFKHKLDRVVIVERDDLRVKRVEFRAWYNHARPRQHLDGNTPAEGRKSTKPPRFVSVGWLDHRLVLSAVAKRREGRPCGSEDGGDCPRAGCVLSGKRVIAGRFSSRSSPVWKRCRVGKTAASAFMVKMPDRTGRKRLWTPWTGHNAFRTLDEAGAATAEWLAIYNEQRTHSAIGHLPLLAFKRRWQQRQFPEKMDSVEGD